MAVHQAAIDPADGKPIVATVAEEPKKKPITLNHAQVESIKPEAMRKLCRFVAVDTGNYYRDVDYSAEPQRTQVTVTKDKDEATKHRISEFKGMGMGIWLCEPLDQEFAASIPIKLCRLDDVIRREVIEMFRAAPKNPQARTILMTIVGQMPPEELDTFEKVKNWVEETYDPNKGKPAPGIVDGKATAFEIRVDVSQAVSGSCLFTGTSSGRGDYPITVADIARFEAGARTPAEITQRVLDHLKAAARRDDDVQMDVSRETAQHTDHRVTNAGDKRMTIRGGTTTVQNYLYDYLRRTLTPQRRRELGL